MNYLQSLKISKLTKCESVNGRDMISTQIPENVTSIKNRYTLKPCFFFIELKYTYSLSNFSRPTKQPSTRLFILLSDKSSLLRLVKFLKTLGSMMNISFLLRSLENIKI